MAGVVGLAGVGQGGGERERERESPGRHGRVQCDSQLSIEKPPIWWPILVANLVGAASHGGGTESRDPAPPPHSPPAAPLTSPASISLLGAGIQSKDSRARFQLSFHNRPERSSSRFYWRFIQIPSRRLNWISHGRIHSISDLI